MGLHASAVLASTGPQVDFNVPSPMQFDHAINTIWLGQKQYWFDSTSVIAPFGYLIPELRGKNSLVTYTDRKPELASTPGDLPWPTKYEVDIDGKGDHSNFEGHITALIRGDYEIKFRSLLLTLPASQLGELLREAAARVNKDAKSDEVSVTDVKASDPYDTRDPLRLDLTLKSAFATPEHKPSSPAEGAEELLKPFLPEAASANGLAVPTNLGGPKEIVLKANLIGAVVPASLPKPVHLSKDFAEYDCDVHADGTALKIYWRLFLRLPVVIERDADDYAAFRRDALKNLKEMAAAFASPASEASAERAAAAH